MIVFQTVYTMICTRMDIVTMRRFVYMVIDILMMLRV